LVPSIIKDLSTSRSIKLFNSTPKFNNKLYWEKAQKLQKHIYQSENLFVFCNSNFFNQKHKKINDRLIDKCISGFIDSKNWTELTQSLIFYMYDTSNGRCECHNFWHYGYCKHSLAVKIHLEELEVNFFFTLK